MAYFEGQAPGGGGWQQPHRRQQSQPTFDQNQGPLPSGGSPTSPVDDAAFGSQFEEVARASDNLAKGGRSFGGMHGRRESMPGGNNFSRQYAELDPRYYGPQRTPSGPAYDGMRSHSSHSSSSLQGYIANQRFGPRQSEADQMMQAKRRAAAQRERELRNYHQEQQYNRKGEPSAAKSDRSNSPNAMSEDDRRELIARQHRALYGDGSNLYDGASPRPVSQDARVLAAASTGQTPSPMGFDSFGSPAGTNGEGPMSLQSMAPPQPRTRTESTSSKSPNPNSFALFDNAQQSNNRTSSSSPGEEQQSRQGPTAPGSSGVAPIGTRPSQTGAQGNRKTPPMQSPLSYGLGNDKNIPNSATERSQSASSNPSNQPNSGAEKSVGLGWNGGGGPWGSSKNLGVQASVWG